MSRFGQAHNWLEPSGDALPGSVAAGHQLQKMLQARRPIRFVQPFHPPSQRRSPALRRHHKHPSFPDDCGGACSTGEQDVGGEGSGRVDKLIIEPFREQEDSLHRRPHRSHRERVGERGGFGAGAGGLLLPAAVRGRQELQPDGAPRRRNSFSRLHLRQRDAARERQSAEAAEAVQGAEATRNSAAVDGSEYAPVSTGRRRRWRRDHRQLRRDCLRGDAAEEIKIPKARESFHVDVEAEGFLDLAASSLGVLRRSLYNAKKQKCNRQFYSLISFLLRVWQFFQLQSRNLRMMIR